MSNLNLSDILAGDGKELSKRTNIVNLIIANILIITSLALFIAASGSSLLILTGVVAFATGVFVCIKGSIKVIYEATGSTVRERSKYIRHAQMNRIAEFLDSANIRADIKLNGAGDVRVDVVTSADGRYSKAMFFQYISYSYEPISEPFEISSENAQKLLELID